MQCAVPPTHENLDLIIYRGLSMQLAWVLIWNFCLLATKLKSANAVGCVLGSLCVFFHLDF